MVSPFQKSTFIIFIIFILVGFGAPLIIVHAQFDAPPPPTFLEKIQHFLTNVQEQIQAMREIIVVLVSGKSDKILAVPDLAIPPVGTEAPPESYAVKDNSLNNPSSASSRVTRQNRQSFSNDVIKDDEEMNGGDANFPPKFIALGDKTAYVGFLLRFRVVASDPEGTKVTYTARMTSHDIPDDAFDEASHTFEWTPTNDDVGKHKIVFSAQDKDGSAVSKTITIIVKSVADEVSDEDDTIADSLNQNHAPTLTLDPDGDQTIEVGQDLTLYLAGDDQDGDDLVYGISDAFTTL